MRIGIDTDGVLTDEATFTRDFGRRYLKREPVYPDKSRIYEVFDFDRHKKWFFCLRYMRAYCRHCPPRPGCRAVLDGLRAEGHALYEITARLFTTAHTPLGWYSRRMLFGWYREHGFQFDEVVLCRDKAAAADKLAACRRLSVDVMIEDNPEIAACLAQNGIRVLLMDAPFNRTLQGARIERVFSWEDIRARLTLS